MKSTTFIKSVRIVPMPITNCLNANPSDVNSSSNVSVSIGEQMKERGETIDFFAETALNEILKDYERAWKTLGNA